MPNGRLAAASPAAPVFNSPRREKVRIVINVTPADGFLSTIRKGAEKSVNLSAFGRNDLRCVNFRRKFGVVRGLNRSFAQLSDHLDCANAELRAEIPRNWRKMMHS
jgi:hypothetical protein